MKLTNKLRFTCVIAILTAGLLASCGDDEAGKGEVINIEETNDESPDAGAPVVDAETDAAAEEEEVEEVEIYETVVVRLSTSGSSWGEETTCETFCGEVAVGCQAPADEPENFGYARYVDPDVFQIQSQADYEDRDIASCDETLPDGITEFGDYYELRRVNCSCLVERIKTEQVAMGPEPRACDDVCADEGLVCGQLDEETGERSGGASCWYHRQNDPGVSAQYDFGCGPVPEQRSDSQGRINEYGSCSCLCSYK